MKKVILGILIGLSLSAISVVAVSLCNAKDIVFSADDETWDVDTVSDALNDLYQNNGNSSCVANVAKPKIDTEEKLIPITLSDDGKATVVSESDPKWYDYCEKKWANAVILNDNAQKYNVGSEINDDDIESYFVWIPKYKYKLWNVNSTGKDAIQQVHSIDIAFDTTNTTDIPGESCVTPMESGVIGSCSDGEYMTHPAFISFGVDGFWVGKFETGHKTATSTSSAQVNNSDSTLIVVKPNVFSWRGATVKNIFEAAYKYERDLDSHMMKNTEWGAVAYLSHSQYGINEKININNNSSYKTGYAAFLTTNQHTYPGDVGDGGTYNTLWNTNVGVTASTTGNITGVYDMSGGAWEYTAANKIDSYGGSGFSQSIIETYDKSYFDFYKSDSMVTSYTNMILGDAMGEMGPFQFFNDGDGSGRYHSIWYNGYAHFFQTSDPWMCRGSYYKYGGLANQFSFSGGNGGTGDFGAFRIVLAGENKHPTNE